MPIAPVAPSVTPEVSSTPDMTRSAVIPNTPESQSSEQRWRAQQQDRQVFAPHQIYTATSPVPLLWYDPLTGQSLEVGQLVGEFPVQATFFFRPVSKQALEVPYRIDQDFGLTAISPAVKQRMEAAGYRESVEAYVIESETLQRKD